MRNLLLIALLASTAFTTQAQKRRTTKAPELVNITNENHKLNSGSRTAVGGQSRIAIPITLPPMTDYMYYTLSTAREKAPTPANLYHQLTAMNWNVGHEQYSKYKADIGGFEAMAPVDVYIVNDERNAQLFLAKKQFAADQNTIAEKLLGGSMAAEIVPNILPQTIYICIKNPSAFDAAYLNLEVVAVKPKL